MTIPVNIRKFIVSCDVDPVIQIAHESFDHLNEEGLFSYPPLTEGQTYSEAQIAFFKNQWSKETIRKIAEEARRGERCILVAESGSQVVGTAGLVEGKLQMVVVRRGTSRSEIAASLIKRIEVIAREQGILQLTAFVSAAGNDEVFYRELGFEWNKEIVSGRRARLFEMSKKLSVVKTQPEHSHTQTS